MSHARRKTGTIRSSGNSRSPRTNRSSRSSAATRSTQTAPPARTNRHALRRDPRAHWLLLLLTLTVAATALLFSGYGRHEIAPTAAPAPHCTAATPAAVRRSGPVLSEAGEKLRSAELPARTVALTYDGGPDPS